MRKPPEKMRTAVKKTSPFFVSSLFLFLTLIFLLTTQSGFTQDQDFTKVNKKRLRTFVIASSVGYTATLIGLHQLWYKNDEHQAFSFFNDALEWKQVDKLGHFFSAYYLSYGTSKALRWSNVPPKKSDIIGAVTGFLVLVPIEIFDGYSDAYGASGGDLLADFAGSSFFLAQQLIWKEQRLIPRFSFHHTDFASQRPDVLGDTDLSEVFKDYNGQTYWLSVDIDKFIRFPKWLNIAVGYGAEGMVYARDDPNHEAGFDAHRQYYLSLDFDLTAVRSRSKVIKTLIFLAGTIKIPAPTVEFSNNKVKFYGLYF